jgi:hypothetical protein
MRETQILDKQHAPFVINPRSRPEAIISIRLDERGRPVINMREGTIQNRGGQYGNVERWAPIIHRLLLLQRLDQLCPRTS